MGTCMDCHYALAADAARDHGIISEPAYEAYIWGRLRDLNGRGETGNAFGFCELKDCFIKDDFACTDWHRRSDRTKFGRPAFR